jgi:hypothetical protein
MRTLSYYQRAWDDRHPDDYRTAADDAAEQAAECMAAFDRREARRRAGLSNDDNEEVTDG